MHAAVLLAPAPLIAEIGAGTLLRCLVLAIIVVAPYGLYQRQKVRRAKAELALLRGDAPAEAVPADPTALETVVAQLENLGTPTTSSSEVAGPFEVDLPASPTIDGRPADPAVVQVVVADAVRRSGLVVVDTIAGDRTGTTRLIVRRSSRGGSAEQGRMTE